MGGFLVAGLGGRRDSNNCYLQKFDAALLWEEPIISHRKLLGRDRFQHAAAKGSMKLMCMKILCEESGFNGSVSEECEATPDIPTHTPYSGDNATNPLISAALLCFVAVVVPWCFSLVGAGNVFVSNPPKKNISLCLRGNLPCISSDQNFSKVTKAIFVWYNVYVILRCCAANLRHMNMWAKVFKLCKGYLLSILAYPTASACLRPSSFGLREALDVNTAYAEPTWRCNVAHASISYLSAHARICPPVKFPTPIQVMPMLI